MHQTDKEPSLDDIHPEARKHILTCGTIGSRYSVGVTGQNKYYIIELKEGPKLEIIDVKYDDITQAKGT